MANVPSERELMRPTIDALKRLGGSGHIDEIFSDILKKGQYPPAVLTDPMPNYRRTRLEYSTYWARTHLGNIGALEKLGKGVWSLTALGRSLSDEEIFKLVKDFQKTGGTTRALEGCRVAFLLLQHQSLRKPRGRSEGLRPKKHGKTNCSQR